MHPSGSEVIYRYGCSRQLQGLGDLSRPDRGYLFLELAVRSIGSLLGGLAILRGWRAGSGHGWPRMARDRERALPTRWTPDVLAGYLWMN